MGSAKDQPIWMNLDKPKKPAAFADVLTPKASDEFITVSPNELHVHPANRLSGLDEDAVLDLMGDMAKNGQITPVIARMRSDNKLEILAGHYRHEVCKRQGINIKVVVRYNIDDITAISILTSDNELRSELTYLDKAMLAKEMEKEGWNVRSIGALSCFGSESTAYRHLRLYNLTRSVRDVILSEPSAYRNLNGAHIDLIHSVSNFKTEGGKTFSEGAVAKLQLELLGMAAKGATISEMTRLFDKAKSALSKGAVKKVRARRTLKRGEDALYTVGSACLLAEKRGKKDYTVRLPYVDDELAERVRNAIVSVVESDRDRLCSVLGIKENEDS